MDTQSNLVINGLSFLFGKGKEWKKLEEPEKATFEQFRILLKSVNY